MKNILAFLFGLTFICLALITHAELPLNLVITTIPPTCGNPNGVIIAKASGGTKPYTYSIDGVVHPIGYFTFRNAGTYSIKVKDATGQEVVQSVALVEKYPRPGLIVKNATPPVGCDNQYGIVELEASGGTPPFQYSNEYLNYQSSNVFSDLRAGKYSFWVKDSYGCVGYILGVYPLVDNCGIQVSGYYYNSGIMCGQTGKISITMVGGGTPPYQYSFDGGPFSSDSTKDGFMHGIHRVLIRDVNGLTEAMNFTMIESCSLDISYVTIDAACEQSDGAMTVTATNGSPPFTYTIDGENFQTSNEFKGLSAGIYNLTVKDAIGATASIETYVYDKCPTVFAEITDENCGNGDATIVAKPNKGTAPYQYSLDGTNFQASPTFTNLSEGTYNLTLKDANGFMAYASIYIPNNCLQVITGTIDANCGKPEGKISILATGGQAPYLYSIDGIAYSTQTDYASLLPGNYTVYVVDAVSTRKSVPVTVKDNPGAAIKLTTSPPSCLLNDGTISIAGTGGTAPYFYQFNGGSFQSASTFSSLTQGTYSVAIADGNGCVTDSTFKLVSTCLSVNYEEINASCGKADGSITIIPDGGVGPFTYSINGGPIQANPLFTNLPKGNYTIDIADAISQKKTLVLQLPETCLSIDLRISPATCGKANGLINVIPGKGNAPYLFNLNNEGFLASGLYNDLPIGNYQLTVKDAKGYKKDTSFAIVNIPGPTIAATTLAASCLNNDGQITVLANGGTAPLQYQVNSGTVQTSGIFPQLAAGNYVISVIDANSCSVETNAVILLNDNLELSIEPEFTLCEGKSWEITINTNGTGYSWSPAIDIINPQTKTPTVSPTVDRQYTVMVTLGVCQKSDSLIAKVLPAPIASAGPDQVICYGSSAQLSGSGGNSFTWTPATYLDDPGSINPNVVEPLQTTTYHLLVSDANGCNSINDVTTKVSLTPPARIFAGNDTVIIRNKPIQLNAVDVNNSGFIRYNWSPSNFFANAGVQSPVLNLDRNATLTVTGETLAGCKGSDVISIKVYDGPEIYVPNAFTPNGDGKNDLLKIIPVGIKTIRYFNIFNRFGKIVFTTNNPGIGWNGKFNNSIQPSGSYPWTVLGIDENGHEIKKNGVIILIR